MKKGKEEENVLHSCCNKNREEKDEPPGATCCCSVLYYPLHQSSSSSSPWEVCPSLTSLYSPHHLHPLTIFTPYHEPRLLIQFSSLYLFISPTLLNYKPGIQAYDLKGGKARVDLSLNTCMLSFPLLFSLSFLCLSC